MPLEEDVPVPPVFGPPIHGRGLPYGGLFNNPFPRIGEGDLDPFHPEGGGMLYDPFNPQGSRRPTGDPTYPFLPPGAVPPGSRYDPIGPPKGDFRNIRYIKIHSNIREQ